MKIQGLLLTIALIASTLAIPISISPCLAEHSEETYVFILGGPGFFSWLETLFSSYYAYYWARWVKDFPPDHVCYLYDDPQPSYEIETDMFNGTSSATNVWQALQWLNNSCGPEDKAVFFYDGHGGGALANGTLKEGLPDINGDEGPEHFNATSGKWFGVDECIVLHDDTDILLDDELAAAFMGFCGKELAIILSACSSFPGEDNHTCFCGGFIDDLGGPGRIIMTSANETSSSWGELDDMLYDTGNNLPEFLEGVLDALCGITCSVNLWGVHQTGTVNADANADGKVDWEEAFQWAFDHDDARKAVRLREFNGTDPLASYPLIDESPWFDDDGDGLPTFKAGYDIFLLGDFNFDGKVDGIDFDIFIDFYNSGEYHPLYDLNENGDVDGYDMSIMLYILNHCCEKRFLYTSATFGGTTDPTPGTYCYFLHQYVNVTAIPDSGYYFTYWLFDGAIKYDNPITVFMDSNHTLRAHWSTGQGGEPCPTLFVWNGTEYVDYGVIDIHNPTGEDVTREVPIQKENVGISNYKAKFRLREGWPGLNFSESVIDQVKLYAVDNYGKSHLCLLISAKHSRLGGVLSYLLASDDYRVQILLLETIDLTFIVPYQNIQSYTFIIEGCNMYKG